MQEILFYNLFYNPRKKKDWLSDLCDVLRGLLLGEGCKAEALLEQPSGAAIQLRRNESMSGLYFELK